MRLVPCIAAAAVAVLAACATPPVGKRDLLGFVQAGAPRSELILKLGQPIAAYEGDRIMTWQIAEDAGGYYVGASSPIRPRYQLVVVFDDSGKVLRHNLVEVHRQE